MDQLKADLRSPAKNETVPATDRDSAGELSSPRQPVANWSELQRELDEDRADR